MMTILKRLDRRLRQAGRALLRADDSLASLARSTEQLNRLAALAERTSQHLESLDAMMARRELAAIMADHRYDNPLRLERSGFSVNSQYDEDGIISEIFSRIGISSQTFVEFGAGIGNENCTGFLVMQGWRGLWIEGRPDFPFFANHTWGREIQSGQLVIKNTFVTVDTIDSVIRDAGFTGEIDLLVVDVDGNDYHFLEKISAIEPRVICAEYNAVIPPHVSWRMARDDSYVWEGIDNRTGASLKALEQLLRGRGYALVGCSLAGVNAFFVRADLTDGKFAEPFTAENHYNPWRFFYSGAAPKTIWKGWRT